MPEEKVSSMLVTPIPAAAGRSGIRPCRMFAGVRSKFGHKEQSKT
ncbi:MAG: hypothetical protein ABH885_03195 [Candidatus Omnitrophota bacterium]